MDVLNKGCPPSETIVRRPPSTPTRRYNSWFHKVWADKPGIELEETEGVSFFCRILLTPGGYAVILAEFFMIKIWISTLIRAGITVMPYMNVFLYYYNTVPRRHSSWFSKNVAQYGVLASTPGSHPQQFQLHSDPKSIDVDCPLSRSDALISNVTWPTKNFLSENMTPHAKDWEEFPSD